MTRYIKVIDGPGTSVTYIEENGYHVIYSGGSRAWRNNNPGNLREGVVSYVEELGWLTKNRAIQMASRGELDVVVVRRGGNKFLRTRPDASSRNNLSEMAKS